MDRKLILIAAASMSIVPPDYIVDPIASISTKASNIKFYNKQQSRKKKGGKVNFK